MEARRRAARAELTDTVARVVPDVAAFAVDDGFAYRVPEGLDLEVGALVRVPLGGRRVRGWVVRVGGGDTGGLREVAGRSGDLPVVSERMIDVLRWASLHYVAPMATLFRKVTPPNVPRRRRLRSLPSPIEGGASPIPAASDAGAAGGKGATHLWVGGSIDRLADLVAPVVGAGRTALVVAATVPESSAIAARLYAALGPRVVSVGQSGAERTAAWVEAATHPGVVVVGTREVASWPLAEPGLVVVMGEGRRGMKDKSTPTVHARDLLARRASAERFPVVLAGVVPTGEALARASRRTIAPGRPWGLVEVADRSGDPPGSGLVGDVARRAMSAVVGHGGTVLLFTHRRVAAQRCVRCRTVRRCSHCGAAPGAGEACARCGAATGGCTECGGGRFEALGASAPTVSAAAARLLGPEAVGEVGSGRPVTVATERDLVAVEPSDLVVVVDADGLLMAPHYRAAEDGLRIMARAIATARPGRGRKGIVQTSDPNHPMITALRRGDPVPAVEADVDHRAELGFPPAGQLAVVESRGLPSDAEDELEEAVGDRAVVLGPAQAGERRRWLLQAPDLLAAKTAIRTVVAGWRELGAKVRIDADPIDL